MTPKEATNAAETKQQLAWPERPKQLDSELSNLFSSQRKEAICHKVQKKRKVDITQR